MKKVFSSNSDLAHIWAQQTQSEGNTKNMFFEGTNIYSYGRHFLAAKFHGNYVLVNSNTYSVSTAKHLNEIKSSLRGLVNYFQVPNPDSPKAQENIDYMFKCIENVYTRAEKTVKVSSEKDFEYFSSNIHEALYKANKFFMAAKVKELACIDVERYNAIKTHFAARYKRYQELNTPEMVAAKAAKKAEKLQAELQADIDLFRDGINRHSLYKLPFDLLRIAGDEVVTSRGARVPLDAARTMLKALLDNRAKEGDKVGEFKLTNYTTETVKIGCHTIQLIEAINVLGK